MAPSNKGSDGGDEYFVGYGKPPRHTQFKPGKSGNPRGRPRKAATVQDLVLKYLRQMVSVTNGGRIQKKSLLDTIVMNHVSKAAKGDHKSTKLVLDALQQTANNPNNKLPELLDQFRAIHALNEATDQSSKSDSTNADAQDQPSTRDNQAAASALAADRQTR